MPKSKFKITVSGQEKELLLTWGMFWKNFKINIGGELVGGFESQKELRLGKDFKLIDGSTLSIKLAQNGLTPELQILKDGQALEGSASAPETRLKTAYGIVLFLGDTVMAFRQSMLLLQNPNFGWIVVRLILGTPIFVGIKTAYKKK